MTLLYTHAQNTLFSKNFATAPAVSEIQKRGEEKETHQTPAS